MRTSQTVFARLNLIGGISGFFEQYAGEVDYDSQRPENSKARLTLESRSVACKGHMGQEKKQRKKIVGAAINDMMAAGIIANRSPPPPQ